MSATLNLVRLETPPMAPPAPTSGIFDIPGCTFTPTGMTIEPGLKIENWIAAGLALRRAGDSYQLCVGDWILYGKKTYKHGEMYKDALKLTGFKEQTLKDNVWVAKSVPPELRLEKSSHGDFLKYNHFKKIAPLPNTREKKKWIKLAAKGDGKRIWSASRLDREINKVAAPSTDPGDKNYLDPHYKQSLLEYIASQNSFLNRSTYEPFRREIGRSIKWAKFQLRRTETSDRDAVLKEVKEHGAATIAEIAEEVPISNAEIRALCVKAVGCEAPRKEGDPREAGTEYEWRPIGVKISIGKGLRPHGIFHKEALSGDDFIADRDTPLVDYEGDEEEHF